METSLSTSTLIHCHCALVSHIDDLRHMLANTLTIELRTTLESEIEDYTAALAEFDNYFNFLTNE